MPFRDATPNMVFGKGIDDLTGEVKDTGVTNTEFEDLTNQGGEAQDVFFRMDRIDSLQEFQESLGLSINGSASFGLFGGSEKFNLVQKSRFNRFSVYLNVHVRVVNAERQLKNVQLLPEARELIANGDMTRFRERFGDVFVRGIRTGAEYFAVLEIETSDEQDQRDLSNDLEASGAFGIGFDVRTKFIEGVNKAAANRKINFTSTQLGGADPSQPTEVEKIVDKASNFALQANQIADKFQVDLAPYTILDLPVAPNFADLQQRKDTLLNASRLRNILLTRLNEIDFILQNTNQFGGARVNLNDLRKQTADAIDVVHDHASRCLNIIQDCTIPSPFIPDFSGLPERLGARVRGRRITIPNVIGLSLRDAQALVEGLGLRFASIAVANGANLNRVKSQDPPALSLVEPNSIVTVTFGVLFGTILTE